MAVSASHFSQDYPEFNPSSLRSRTHSRTHSRTKPANRRVVRAISEVQPRVRVRRHSLAARVLRSRLMDDVCAVIVAASGVFFAFAIVRMLLMH